MHGDRERRERGDDPVVESVVQSVPQGGQTGSGTLGPHPHDDDQNERDDDERKHGRPRQRTHGRESERDGDDLRRREKIDGEEKPDRRAQAQAARCERCGRDDERERAAKDHRAHAFRLIRYPAAAGNHQAFTALSPIAISEIRAEPARRTRPPRRLRAVLDGAACYGRAPYAMSAEAPEISVVIPCLNEEEAVGAVVDQAWEGIRRSARRGEVIVVDNASTDRSAEVAAEHGATVVREERPGYGSAYLAGLAVARGEYIVMGDADETYPIRDLAPFVDRLAEGDDLVMGSRFEGTIHGEAMPWLNRHVGNPILTGLLNVLFGVKISDAHCGMRAVRSDALPTLDLHSTGMEFASEMVFKAFRRKLRVSEIPIDYYPRVGESKLNRFGDAWRHVKFMLLYSPSWLYFVPGLILSCSACSARSPSRRGP